MNSLLLSNVPGPEQQGKCHAGEPLLSMHGRGGADSHHSDNVTDIPLPSQERCPEEQPYHIAPLARQSNNITITFAEAAHQHHYPPDMSMRSWPLQATAMVETQLEQQNQTQQEQGGTEVWDHRIMCLAGLPVVAMTASVVFVVWKCVTSSDSQMA